MPPGAEGGQWACRLPFLQRQVLRLTRQGPAVTPLMWRQTVQPPRSTLPNTFRCSLCSPAIADVLQSALSVHDTVLPRWSGELTCLSMACSSRAGVGASSAPRWAAAPLPGRLRPARSRYAGSHPPTEPDPLHAHTYTHTLADAVAFMLAHGLLHQTESPSWGGLYSNTLCVHGLPMDRLRGVVAPHALGVMGHVW